MQSSSSSSTTASSSTTSSSNTVVSLIKRSLFFIAVVLRIFLWPLLKLSSSLFPANEFDGLTNQRVLDASARAFASFFQTNYYLPAVSSDNSTNNSGTSNLFQTVGYHACVNESTRQNKCILIYLHSPLHRDSHKFCQNVLASSTFMNVISSHQHMLNLWGGSIHTADGANVAKIYNVTSYPFLALVACRQGRTSLELLLKMEGLTSTQELVPCLSMAFHRHSAVLNELEMRRLQREEEIRLRQEQDREYHEALLADQRREYEKRRASEEAEAAQRAREEQEDRQQRQKEQLLAEARLSVPEQPPSTTPRSEATHIRFTLPSGARMDRRFYAKDTLAMVRAFLVVYFSDQSITIERFSISTNYPKKTFTQDHDGLSLSEAGLVPQAVLMIQDLDA